jgi:hypothetical protein
MAAPNLYVINSYIMKIIGRLIVSFLITIISLLPGPTTLNAQAIKVTADKLENINVSMSIEKIKHKRVVKVVKDAAVQEFDEPTFVKMKGIEFKDGTIEVRVLSKLLPDAPEFSRGFIGIAFRIDESNSKFECIYLRPLNEPKVATPKPPLLILLHVPW